MRKETLPYRYDEVFQGPAVRAAAREGPGAPGAPAVSTGGDLVCRLPSSFGAGAAGLAAPL
jgi:hypothetical protein